MQSPGATATTWSPSSPWTTEASELSTADSYHCAADVRVGAPSGSVLSETGSASNTATTLLIGLLAAFSTGLVSDSDSGSGAEPVNLGGAPLGGFY
jgi:hypothetical protein